jgi:chemotaxis protein histidine kinase CheA
MIALFATEAMSLLKSVQEVLTEMQRSDTPGRQIGCLFRMMRSLRLAAGRLGFGQIKDLAQALEHNYIQWRVHSSYMNPMGILTISGAHEILRRNIEAMHSKHGLDYDSKYSLARETNLKVQELRSVIDADS